MESLGTLLDGLMNIPSFKRAYERTMQDDSGLPPQVAAEKRILDRVQDLEDKRVYDCSKCKNRGFLYEIVTEEGQPRIIRFECDCMRIRRSFYRMKKSRLESTIRQHTFKSFNAQAPWQQDMLQKAREYSETGLDRGMWFFIGGQPGCGKTHLCTAIAREALYRGDLSYMVWPEESQKLRALSSDPAGYRAAIDPFKTVQTLYIDDLFKPAKDFKGNLMPPTATDVRLAFEILNQRYINGLPAIISSEWTLPELTDIDEAVASRICEKSRGYSVSITRDRRKNMRLG